MTIKASPQELAEFRQSLEDLKWSDLRAEAGKYGVRVVPEYKKEDLIRLMIDKKFGQAATIVDQQDLGKKEERFGWSRIIVEPGRTERDSVDCRACHNGYQFIIPYGLEVNIPTVTAEFLAERKAAVGKSPEDGGPVRIEKFARWNVQFLERNYGPNGERGYIPVSERSKYWTSAREAKLANKRKFYQERGYWPTDKVLSEEMRSLNFHAANAKQMEELIRAHTNK